jgi:rod shape determining protein RodA
MLKGKVLFNFDILIIISTISLIIIGILFIYSSGMSSEGFQRSTEFIRQIVWSILGLTLMIIITLFKNDWLKDFSPYFFLLSLGLLFFTLRFGRTINGSRAWIGIGTFGIQPSEFTKLTFVLVFAYWLEKNPELVKTLKGIIISFILFLSLPLALILMQPDLGTAVVFIPAYLVMLLIAGAKGIHLTYISFVGLVGAIFAALPLWEERIYRIDIPLLAIFNEERAIYLFSLLLLVLFIISITSQMILKKRIFYWLTFFIFCISSAYGISFLIRLVLREYQIMRLIVFLDPEVDRLGAGWHIIQSLIAVGSGGISGKGFLQGTQSQLQFLPEQSTDFIFSIIAEEWGFVGAVVLFTLYGILLIRMLRISFQSKDNFGSYVVVGIATIFLFHFIVNVGMNIGIMPIMGIPLLLVSYGGSQLWFGLMSIGVVLNVGLNKFQY